MYSVSEKQCVVAIRLNSYLIYWQNWIHQNDFFGVYYLGVKWNAEIKNVVESDGTAEYLIKLEQDKKEFVKETTEEVKSGSDELRLSKDELDALVAKLPSNASDLMLRYVELRNQNLLDGKKFISDNDASYLGPALARVCMHLKLISLADMGMMLMLGVLSSSKDFELKNYGDELGKILWKAIEVSKGIDNLSRSLDKYMSESVLKLTFKNLDWGNQSLNAVSFIAVAATSACSTWALRQL